MRTRTSQPAGLLFPYPAATQPTSRPGDDAGMRMLLPVGRSGWAIAAGYLGLIGSVIWPLAPLALVAAELGRRQIARDPHSHGSGRVTLGYIGGTIGVLGLLAFLLLS